MFDIHIILALNIISQIINFNKVECTHYLTTVVLSILTNILQTANQPLCILANIIAITITVIHTTSIIFVIVVYSWIYNYWLIAN